MAATKRIETNKASPDFIKQLAGYGLATARILYHLPDYPRLLQTYIWQDYDLAPEFPDHHIDAAIERLEAPVG